MTAGPPLTTYLSLSDDCASVYVAMMLGGQRGGLRGHGSLLLRLAVKGPR